MEKITATKITILLQIYRVQSVTHLYQCIILLQTSTMMKTNEIKDSIKSKQKLEDSIEEYIKNKRKEFYEVYGVSLRLRGQVHKIKGSRPIPSQYVPLETRTKDKEV